MLRLIARVVGGAALHALMQFHRALEEQEQAAQDQDQVAAGYLRAQQREQGFGQRDDPGDARQQAQAHNHCQRQADQARAVALRRRQLVRQDGDEHQVVDAQHNFKHDQRRQAEPGGGVGHPIENHQSSTESVTGGGETPSGSTGKRCGGRGRATAAARGAASGGARQPRRGVTAVDRRGSLDKHAAQAGALRGWGIGRQPGRGAALGGGSSVIDGGRPGLPGQHCGGASTLLSFLLEPESYLKSVRDRMKARRKPHDFVGIYPNGRYTRRTFNPLEINVDNDGCSRNTTASAA
ncbi:hypothetical protein D9M68_338650 [compost metagenome]